MVVGNGSDHSHNKQIKHMKKRYVDIRTMYPYHTHKVEGLSEIVSSVCVRC